ncbi:uncharacterized protein SCHCODRAFT_02534685 [Schizophyllum commune H4-8]|nr:uncharacterized protein SCHCODRAFT_02534685 [Schizophyllum commune H4-8]KAI5894644.1 hypothetical protein SCHCODRAFT_02534685 [Schizophyllum commune H4-8]
MSDFTAENQRAPSTSADRTFDALIQRASLRIGRNLGVVQHASDTERLGNPASGDTAPPRSFTLSEEQAASQSASPICVPQKRESTSSLSVDGPNSKRCPSRSPPPLQKSYSAKDTQRAEGPGKGLHSDLCPFMDVTESPTGVRKPKAQRDQRMGLPLGSLSDSASTMTRHEEKSVSHDSEEDSDMDWSIDAYGSTSIEDSSIVDDSETQSDGVDFRDRDSTGAEGCETTALMSDAGIDSSSNDVSRDVAGPSHVLLYPNLAIFPYAYGPYTFIPLTVSPANVVHSNDATVIRKLCPWALDNGHRGKGQCCNVEVSGDGLRDFMQRLQGHIQTAHNPPIGEKDGAQRYLCRAILETPGKTLCRSRITTGFPYQCRLAGHIAREHLGMQVPRDFNPYAAECSSV